MMNSYKVLKDMHQTEVNAFPLGFAFSSDQFVEMMRKWKLCNGPDGRPTENDCKQILSIGAGGYVRRSDADAMHAMFERHANELAEAIASDKTGLGFVYDMFRYEMANHEYGYTGDPYDTLMACGLSMNDIQNDPALYAGWKKAREVTMKEYDECNA